MSFPADFAGGPPGYIASAYATAKHWNPRAPFLFLSMMPYQPISTSHTSTPPKFINPSLAESAGTHLALLLSRYLRHLGLSQPGYIALSSPRADLSTSYPSYKSNKDYVRLCPQRLRMAAKSGYEIK
nr:hypothetical protein I308_01544 [Cryptococcus tetragattii IND107]